MAKAKDAKFYLNQLKKSKSKAKKLYLTNRTHNYELYNSQSVPHSIYPENEEVGNINEVYPNIETQRASIGFRYPKVTLKAKRPNFFIRKVQGDPGYEQLTEMPSLVFKQMQEQGVKQISQVEQGKTVVYTILDGPKTSKIIQEAVNQYVKDKNVEQELSKAKDDIYFSGMGAVWTDFYSSFYLPTEESEFKKYNDIVVEYGVVGKDFMIDPTVKDPNNLSRANWVAKKFFVPRDDLEAIMELKGPNGKPMFKKNILKELMEFPEHGTLYYDDICDGDSPDGDSSVYNPTGEDKELDNDDRSRGYNFWQYWIKPSLAQRIDPKSKFRRGKVTYYIEGVEEEVCEARPWLRDTDEFPLDICVFNAANDRLYPIPDIQVYEEQLAENNKYRSLQRDLALISSRIKGIINTEDLNNIDLDKLKRDLNDPNNRILPVNGFKKDSYINLNMGNQPTNLWTMDQKTSQDIQRLSLIPNAAKGQVAGREVSATLTAVGDRGTTSRNQHRQYMLSLFWIRVIGKIIALMQQYYTLPRMITITGETDIEWVRFNRENIQGEYDVEVDVLSMNPQDVITQRNDLTNLLNMMIGLLDNPSRFLKLLSEGYTINLSEIINQILVRMEISNDDIFPKVKPQTKQAASAILSQQLQVPGGVGGGSSSGASTKATPSASTEKSTDVAKTGGPFISPGAVQSPGGQGKVQ